MARSFTGIYLNNHKYVLDMIKDFGLANTKVVQVPLLRGLKLHDHASLMLPDPNKFHNLVGKILYLNMTTPDITFLNNN